MSYTHKWSCKHSRYLAINRCGVGVESSMELVLNCAGHIEVMIDGTAHEFINLSNHSVEHRCQEYPIVIQRYTDQQMELEALNEGWIVGLWDECPVDSYLMLDVVHADGDQRSHTDRTASIGSWGDNLEYCGTIIAYRLSNATGYKDGVKTEWADPTNSSFTVTDAGKLYYAGDKPKWNGEGKPPVGEVCEVKINKDSEGFVEIEILYLSNEWSVFKCQPLGELAYKTSKLEFRPIDKKKQRVVWAALRASDFRQGFNEEFSIECLGKLYDAGRLIDPDQEDK